MGEKKYSEGQADKGTQGWVRITLKRWFIDGLGYMAQGLFASLVIGLIISQLSLLPYLGFMQPFANVLAASSPVVGAAIGVAVAYGIKVKPLCVFSSAATGAFGYSLGGPMGSYVAALVGAEISNLLAGKTKVDIVVLPFAAIISGGLAGSLVGPGIQGLMTGLGNFINTVTTLHPLPMGIIVSVSMGMILTAPISSAALAIAMGLDGLAAGAATIGCCANMVGFAVISFQENGMGGLISQGLGTSMLQVPNIVRKPVIWLPVIVASAVLGPIATTVVKMYNTPVGAGMGTSGLVGQVGTWSAMSAMDTPLTLIMKIALLHFFLPAIISLIVAALMRKRGWIKPGDMKLNL